MGSVRRPRKLKIINLNGKSRILIDEYRAKKNVRFLSVSFCDVSELNFRLVLENSWISANFRQIGIFLPFKVRTYSVQTIECCNF